MLLIENVFVSVHIYLLINILYWNSTLILVEMGDQCKRNIHNKIFYDESHIQYLR